MKKRSFYKDISRTLKNNVSRFIAISVMVALGSGVFIGFAVGCLNVFQSANRFYDEQNMYDIKIASTLGLTKEDLTAVSDVTGVKAVFGDRSLDVKVMLNGGKSQLANLTTLDPEGMNKPYVLKGTLPAKAGQIAVNSKFLKDTGLKIGDTITLKKSNISKKSATKTTKSTSSTPRLTLSEYKITAIILSPLDISNKSGGMASVSLSSGSSNYMLYATSDCIKSDIFTSIYLTLEGVSKLDCYSVEYRTMVDNMTSTIETTIKKEREQARYDEVVGDAKTKIVESEDQLADEIIKAEQKLTDAQAKIDDALAKIKDGWIEVKANEVKLADGEQELGEAQKSTEAKFVASQKEIDHGRKELNTGEAKLNNEEKAALQKFSGYEELLAQNKDDLEKERSKTDHQLSSIVNILSENAQQIWNSKSTMKIWADMISDGENAAPYLLAVKQMEKPTSEQTKNYSTAMAAIQADTQALAGRFASAGAPLTMEQLNTFSSLAITYGTLNYSQTQLKVKSVDLAKQKTDALGKISKARQKIEDSKAKLILGQKKLEEGKATAAAQFADKKQEITDGKQKIEDSKKELNDTEKKLKDAQIELNEKKSDYKKSISTAQKKLANAKDEISNISMAKWYVWDRRDNDSFAGLRSDISFIQEITKAFPLIFFMVAILISLTTMTRMVEEDRGLIGTYKSLGYTKYQISLKYILYSVLACIIGGILGAIIGFCALPKVIEIIVSTLYVLPTFRQSFYLAYGLGGFGLFLLAIVGATAFSCVEMLHKRPSELMRPKAPKAGSRILLERIPFLWKRLNFLNKVTCRNLFRYKKRAIMTIVGILGCTMLIVFGFGIRDTVGGLMSDQFDTITVYDAIVVTDKLNNEEMKKLANEWNASQKVKSELQIKTTTLTLHNKGNNLDIAVMVIPDGADLSSYIHLRDSVTHKSMSLPTDGIVVTQNAAKQLKITNKDTVLLQNEENLEHDFPVAFVATNFAGNYVYISESCYQAAFGDYMGNSFLLKLSDQSIGQKWLDKLNKDKRILTVSNSQKVKDTFHDVSYVTNMVVYLLIGMSAVLAFAVLFTLSNINISERERELATIKVLGFYPKEVHSYVNKETLILTVLGILLGLPTGYGITYLILSNVSIADIAFKVRVSSSAYLIAVVLTLIFTLIVNRITNQLLRKINMVEALKSVE